MGTVFSHIVQKRLSAEYENVATEALAYVLDYSDAARRGMMKLLQTFVSDLPPLRFEFQKADGAIRPDMWGLADNVPRLFVENKFWAGFTKNQPVAYLKQLAGFSQPSLLLVVAPDARKLTVWRILQQKLADAGISNFSTETTIPGCLSVGTQIGPTLALTSWEHVLSVLHLETENDARTRNDLNQLKALCVAADNEAFQPIAAEEISNQRTPGFVTQLGLVVRETYEHALNEKILTPTRLKASHNWQFIGRYIEPGGPQGAGAWFGIHFELWRSHGNTPLWLVFHGTAWGRAHDVRRLIDPWAERERKLTVAQSPHFAVALNIPIGEEKDYVVHDLAVQIKTIAGVLAALPPRATPAALEEPDEVSE